MSAASSQSVAIAAESCFRCPGVERHVDRACPQHAVDRGNHLDALREMDPDAIVGTNPAGDQCRRHAIGRGFEFAVGEAPAAAPDGDALGVALGRLTQQMLEQIRHDLTRG